MKAARRIQSNLMDKIRETQVQDETLRNIRAQVKTWLLEDFVVVEDGALRYVTRLCVPSGCLREDIIQEAYQSHYSMHPRANKDVQGPKGACMVGWDEDRSGDLSRDV